jgi:hypothetical protein
VEALIPLALQLVPGLANMIGSAVGGQAGSVIQKIGQIAGSIFGTTDPASIQAQIQEDQIKADIFKSALAGLIESDKAQGVVNAEEAKSPSFFVAGWRPFIGWVCGGGLTYQFIAFPFIAWACGMAKVATPPQLDLGTLMSLLTGMLGLATVRSYEKFNDIDTTSILKAQVPNLGALFGKKK